MDELILHVGISKTGATSLQHFLLRSREKLAAHPLKPSWREDVVPLARELVSQVSQNPDTPDTHAWTSLIERNAHAEAAFYDEYALVLQNERKAS